jgi:catechol 2,3-dioxygenase-like lactoylglutathione lyase family enzyme
MPAAPSRGAFRLFGIDHVQIAAPPGCEDAARRFFGELLGMPELEKPAALKARGGVWFQCGDTQLHVGVETDFSPARKAHPAIAVGNLAALRARLEQAGTKITEDNVLPGVLRFYADDPFGNRLEFVQPEA